MWLFRCSGPHGGDRIVGFLQPEGMLGKGCEHSALSGAVSRGSAVMQICPLKSFAGTHISRIIGSWDQGRELPSCQQSDFLCGVSGGCEGRSV